MYIEPDLLESVGFLYEGIVSREGSRREHIGTCFFVTVWNHTLDGAFGYIVTAKHVIDGLSNILLRVNKRTVRPRGSGVQYIPLSTNWYHHSDDTADLAVLPWGSVKNNFVLSSLRFDVIAATPEIVRENGGRWPPGVGEPFVFIGLMTQVAGINRNYPIVRRGHLALVTNEKISGKYGPPEYYIADLLTYPGHSGGPVWVAYGQHGFLLGIMAAGYEQPIVVRKGKKRKTEQINLGMSLLVPVEKLKDILTSDALEERRKQGEATPIKPFLVGYNVTL